MEILRSIVCPSEDAIAFLQAWMPGALVKSSRFYCPTTLSDVPTTARDVIYLRELQTLVIHDVRSTHPSVIDDQEDRTKDLLTINASSEQFEIVVVAPTLFIMLFETQEVFQTVFGHRANEYLNLMGSYDPERAIREAGTSVREIIANFDSATLDRLRNTITAKRILQGIAILDAKPFAAVNGGDYVVHRRPPQFRHWD
ncbi:hypothetical protein UC34_01800 [Pandoraea vervacti]|uniref:Uncharacterized protein n=1 Tax=Pandoraea vervacti TaxID=656178 RepID=A0ABN4FM29_9BURK|nr:hypothetical protein [Pandoraea vervacti]AJP56072.1 hypothetical protein UC34_01800 [Pandoraea vervacti]